MRYSTKAQTVESAEPSAAIQTTLTILIISHIVVSVVLMGFGIYFFTQCDSSFYAGFTPVSAALFLLEGLLTCFIHACCVMRLLSLMVCVLNFVTASVILIVESASYRCSGLPAPSTNKFCENYRKATNICSWVLSMMSLDDPSESIGAPESSATRLGCVIVAILALLCTMGMLCLLSCGIKLGQPVYLALKRHRMSIVVGHSRNAEIACKNKLLNTILIVPKPQEEQYYESRKNECVMQYIASLKEAAQQQPAKEGAKANESIGKGASKGG